MKYLEIADFHYNPNRKAECITAFNNIIKASEDVDFLVFAGDLFDLPIYANDDLNVLIDLFKQVKKPCCGVCGTQGHEVRSMYKALILSTGFVLLEPAKEYGYTNGEIIPTNNTVIPEVLIYGLDEVNKKSVMALHPELKPSEVTGYCCSLLEKTIKETIAAKRSRLPDTPAVLVLHGNVSESIDRVSEKIEALKRADIVIKTDWIKEADITRTSCGHIHQYIEFDKINGGYGGSPAWNWNSIGFIPSFNLVDLTNNSVTRIPYGTPKREKITEPLDKYDSNIAYWLEYDGELDLNPALNGGHEWSRMTIPEKEKTSRRIDVAEVENKKLSEIAEIFDKNITESQKQKLDEAEKSKTTENRLSRSVRVEKVEVENCILFHGKTLKIDLNNINGLVQLVGRNGSGKSSVLGFCTPYPCLVGKDTESGRISAIKDFFENETGKIRKLITVNGTEHEHIIMLNKGKCEFFVNIKGRSVLEKSNFDEMFNWCEKEYGNISDYITTSFYIQPLQCKTESGLMTASQTTIRDIVQNIAGINRESEKQYCLDRVSEIEEKTKNTKLKIELTEERLKDFDKIKEKEKEMKILLDKSKEESESLQNLYTEKNNALQKRKAEKEENDKKIALSGELKIDICKKTSESHNIKESLADINDLKARKENLDKETALYNDYLKKYASWSKAEAEKQRILNAVNQLKSEHENALKQKSLYEKEMELYNKPCPNCGYICDDNKKHIEELKVKIAALNIAEPDLSELRKEYAAYMNIVKPVEVKEPESVESLNVALSMHEEDEKKLIALESEIKSLEKQLSEIKISNIDLSDEENEVLKLENDLKLKRMEVDVNNSSYAETQAQVKTLENDKTEILRLKEGVKASDKELVDWKYCADVLKANKIPAMELDAVLDTIDRTATANLKGYRNGRYLVMTETQKEGKKSVIDKFDITIMDCESGITKSFKNFSVGEKSFILGAYNNALLDIRKGKNNIDYYPVISDEQDAFIDKNDRSEFYKMNETKNILVVSHSSDIENFIENKINMSDVLY